MKTLLFLNSHDGSQIGIEEGFKFLKQKGIFSDLKWVYYESIISEYGLNNYQTKLLEIANEFLPKLIIIFHIGKTPISINFVGNLRSIKSAPLIIYDEGDMYGGFSKPISKSMKIFFKNSDYVSIRGLGRWYKTVSNYNKNVIYTPHSNSLSRITDVMEFSTKRERKITFIGNRVTSRIGNIRRLAGAKERQLFVEKMSENFPHDLEVYGAGWEYLTTNKGKLDFNMQTEICNKSFIHISYEHYPNIPYYFSDRLPIAMASGQIYVCHYHKGYSNIFKNCDSIYFFDDFSEAVDIINYLYSLSETELEEKSKHSKKFIDQYLSPQVVWENLIKNIREFKNLNE